jgi:hypothetical protein
MSRDFSAYFSLSKNWHPMAAMQEGGGSEIKTVFNYFNVSHLFIVKKINLN